MICQLSSLRLRLLCLVPPFPWCRSTRQLRLFPRPCSPSRPRPLPCQVGDLDLFAVAAYQNRFNHRGGDL